MSNQLQPTSTAPRYSGGQIAMLVIGGLMLLPGMCSLFIAIPLLSDLRTALKDPLGPLVLIMLGICFAISAVGILLIVLARRGARRAR